MKRPPLFIAPDALAVPHIRLTGAPAHHALHVLRLAPGDQIRVSDGRDTVYTAEIRRCERAAVAAAVIGDEPLPPEPHPAVEIVQVLPKPALADRLLPPCTALGVAAFHLVPGDRSPAAPRSGSWDDRLGRWRKLIRGAAEQSERGREPPCALHGSLNACFAAAPADMRLVGDEATAGGDLRPLADRLAAAPDVRTIQWVIGPEGGFSNEEREQFPAWELAAVPLGPHILRLEIAAIVAASITFYELSRL